MEGLDDVYISCDGTLFVGLVVLMLDRYWLSGLLEECRYGVRVIFFIGDGVREEREMMGCWAAGLLGCWGEGRWGKQAWEERTRK